MIYFPLLSRETLRLLWCCVDLRNSFYYHTIKSVDARYFCSVERLLYALGAGRQGRVSCELQKTITLSLLWHPLFFAPTQRRTKLVRGFVR